MAEDKPKRDRPQWVLTTAPFLIGGVSGSVATTCIHPIDMVKVRLQLVGEGAKGSQGANPLALARAIIAEGSFLRLYNGLSAAYLRQFTYTTLRIGFFDSFLGYFRRSAEQRGTTLGFKERAAAALSAGGLASWMANPAEVALVRMQSDGMRPAAQRANYRSVFHALINIARNEGIRGLWRGSGPTVTRACATNFGQLAFFAESKDQLRRRTTLSDQTQTFTASAIAGFFAAFFSLPFDFMKTRLQKSANHADGSPAYRGMVDCAVKVARDEGLLRFYRGFGMYFLRIAPHSYVCPFPRDNSILTYTLLESLP